MVKSRRAASSCQSSVKATVARRPSVETSRRRRGDFDRLAVADRGDGAMIDAGRNRLDPRRLESLDHFVGTNPRGEVDVVDRQAEQFVAHRAADIAGQAVVGAERLQQPPDAAAAAPLGGVELQLHCSLRDRLTSIAAVAPQILPSVPVDLGNSGAGGPRTARFRGAGWRGRGRSRAAPRTSRRLRAHAARGQGRAGRRRPPGSRR